MKQAILDASAAEVRNLFTVLSRELGNNGQDAIERFKNGLRKNAEVTKAALAALESVEQEQ